MVLNKRRRSHHPNFDPGVDGLPGCLETRVVGDYEEKPRNPRTLRTRYGVEVGESVGGVLRSLDRGPNGTSGLDETVKS